MPLSDHQVDPGRYVADEDDNRFVVTDSLQGTLGTLLLLTDDDGNAVLKHRATVVDTFSETDAPERPEEVQQASDAERIAQLEALVSQLANGSNTDKAVASQEVDTTVSKTADDKPATKPAAKRASRSRARK